MNYVLLLLLFSVNLSARSWVLPLYGEDNRTDYSKAKSDHRKLAKSTAALIVNSFLVKSGKKYRIDAPTLEEMDGVCSTERYRHQPAASLCSGTLIAPDLILTAAHCYTSESVCQNASWVFGFHDNKKGEYLVKEKNLYRCQEIVYHSFNLQEGHDFALVKLDRKVQGRSPIKLRPSGQPKLQQKLILVGHPRGLPTKIADDAWITELKNGFFLANVDAYTGNSGSGVFNADTGFLEGILSFGKEDYRETENRCMVSQVYDMLDGGEGVMMIDPIRDFLKTYQEARP